MASGSNPNVQVNIITVTFLTQSKRLFLKLVQLSIYLSTCFYLQKSSIKDEMSFSTFTSLPYQNKLDKTQHAYTYMAKQLSTMTNEYLRAYRNYYRMVELYADLLMFNQIIRCACQNLDGNTVEVVHEYMTQPASHAKVQNLLTECFDLLEDLSNKSVTSAQMDVLFVQAHEINKFISGLRRKYKIVYNWDRIFNSPNYIVPM